MISHGTMFMRKYLMTGFAVLTGLTGCGNKRPSAGKPYKAIVVALTSVDNNGSAHFSLAERSFFALSDMDSLDGTYVRMLRGGELTIKDVDGSLVSADTFSGGESPDLRYRLDGDVAVPLDYSTLAMLSAYYQFDYVYANIESVLGVAPSTLQEKLPGGKHTVLFEPELTISTSDAEINAGLKLNAAFSPPDKQFLLFQRSAIEGIPLSSNLQVLSHEFGHSLFDYAFFDGVYSETNYLGDTYALHGMNEGWADFVSWMFTQSPDILRASIDIGEIADARHITKTTFTWDTFVSQSLGTASATGFAKCADSFYCIGTLFARSLIQTKTDLTDVSAKDFAAGLVASLRSAQAEINAMDSTIVPLAISIDSEDPETLTAWTRQGQFTSAFLRALVKNANSSWKSSLCTNFAANFGSNGFTSDARNGVCP